MTSPCRKPDEPDWWPEKPPRRRWRMPSAANVGDTIAFTGFIGLGLVGIAAVLFGVGAALVDCRDADAECHRRGGVWVEGVVTYECVEPAREKTP